MGNLKFCLILCAQLMLLSNEISSVKILSVSFISTKSHFITYEPLLYALAERGHEVTIVNSVQSSKPVKNVRRIMSFDTNQMSAGYSKMFFEAKEKEQSRFWDYLSNPFYTYIDFFESACIESYKLPEIQALKKEKFDLILFPPMGNDCVYGLVHELNASTILFGQMALSHHVLSSLGSPMLPSIAPLLYYGMGERMDFWERTLNLVGVLYYDLMRKYYYFPRMEAIYREYVSPNLPGVEEIERNSSLALVNSHINFIPPRPNTPDIIEVGGLHLRDGKPLTAEFKEFCDDAKDGLIIFTMGSIIKLNEMKPETINAFLSAFSKLKQRVIWKWEVEPLPNLPPNILQRKWLPQQDILAHNNTRLFITHGGYGSTSEALFAGVPLLGIPIMAEQQWNVDTAVQKGFALTINYKDITEETLTEALDKLLNEPRYLSKAKFLSQLYRDHTQSPLERAIYWVEYVIRYQGATHLWSVGRELSFVQYYSLDSAAFLASSLLLVLSLIVCSLRGTIRLLLKTTTRPGILRGKKKQ